MWVLHFFACLGMFGSASGYVFWIWYGTFRHGFLYALGMCLGVCVLCSKNIWFGVFRCVWYVFGKCSGMVQHGLFEAVEICAFVWYGMLWFLHVWVLVLARFGYGKFWVRSCTSHSAMILVRAAILYADFGFWKTWVRFGCLGWL